jgi:hypothetical protein
MLSEEESIKNEKTNDIMTKSSKNGKEVFFLNKYKDSDTIESQNINTLDSLLEKEKQNLKSEQWNKIGKTTKIQLLHGYAERYGTENKLPVKEIRHLKTFFTECLNKGKLSKNKDITYIKETQHITAIPALHFNIEKKSFTLRITDNKRVSTLKSLTPKKSV